MASQIYVSPLEGQRITGHFSDVRDIGVKLPSGITVHGGIDLVGSSTVVRPITDGIVGYDFDGYNPKYRWDCDLPHACGNSMKILHPIAGKWYWIRYVHLESNTCNAGDVVTVEAGKDIQPIGIYGDVGYSFGAHLHMDATDLNGVVVNIEELLSSVGIL